MSEQVSDLSTAVKIPSKRQVLHGNIMSVSAIFQNVWISAGKKNHYLAESSAFSVRQTQISFILSLYFTLSLYLLVVVLMWVMLIKQSRTARSV